MAGPNAPESLISTILILIALFAVATGLGRLLLGRFRLHFSSFSEELCFSLGLGLAALSALVFILGHFGLLKPAWAWGLMSACCLAGSRRLSLLLRELLYSLRTKHPWEGSSIEMLTLFSAGTVALAMLAISLAPPSSSLALSRSLALPLRWVALGNNHPGGLDPYAWFPAATEQLRALCIALDSVRLATLFDLGLLMATSLILADAGARFLPAGRLWLAPALFLTQPWVAGALGDFSPAPFSVFLSFLSLVAFLNTRRERSLEARSGWLKLSAFFAGAAVAAQPQLLTHTAALLALMAAAALKGVDDRRPGLLLFCAGLFLLPLVPWLFRNGLIYPGHLGLSVFSGSAALDVAHWPGFLFVAVLPAVFFIRYSSEMRWLGVYLLLLLGTLVWTQESLLLLLPGLALFAAYGYAEMEAWIHGQGWRLSLRLAVLAGLFVAAGHTIKIVVRDLDPFACALGLESQRSYLASRGVNYLTAADWIASRATHPKILVLGDGRSAYLPVLSEPAPPLAAQPFKALLDQAEEPADLDAMLVQKGYDFVLVNNQEWARLQQATPAEKPFDYFSSPQKKALYSDWLLGHGAIEGPFYSGEGILAFPLTLPPKT
ncbi:MAG: hypothetical protein V4498_07660 [candidate division FCPU426 bacterium]